MTEAVLSTVPPLERDRSASPSIWPLPLTPLEHSMVADDRPHYPMAFVIEILLSGEMNRGALEQAISSARERHPLLNSVIRRRGMLNWQWHPSHVPFSIDWREPGDRSRAIPHEPMDLRCAPGLRVWVVPSSDPQTEHRVAFEFHHAATDGLGAMQFIGDVLAIYGQLTAPDDAERPEVAPLDPLLLCQRGQLWEPGTSPSREWKRIIRRTLDVIVRYPRGLAAGSAPRTTPTAPFVSRLLDRAALNGLKAAATRAGATLNDLCVAAMFRTLRKWNQLHGKSSDRDWLRIFVPFSLRTPVHDASPAANILTYVPLTRRACQLDFDTDLMRYVARESQTFLNHVDGRIFSFWLGVAQSLPGAIELATMIPFRFCTAVLANVGDVKRQLRNRFPLKRGKCVAGSLTLEALLGAAPIRPGTHLGASLGTYAGQFFVNFNYDPQRIALAEAEEIADLFIDRLLALARPAAADAPTAAEA